MKLEEISKNLDKLVDEEKFEKSLDKSIKSILEVIRDDPHYYKDKPYARLILEDVNKRNNDKK